MKNHHIICKVTRKENEKIQEGYGKEHDIEGAIIDKLMNLRVPG